MKPIVTWKPLGSHKSYLIIPQANHEACRLVFELMSEPINVQRSYEVYRPFKVTKVVKEGDKYHVYLDAEGFQHSLYINTKLGVYKEDN